MVTPSVGGTPSLAGSFAGSVSHTNTPSNSQPPTPRNSSPGSNIGAFGSPQKPEKSVSDSKYKKGFIVLKMHFEKLKKKYKSVQEERKAKEAKLRQESLRVLL
eukprot:693801-Amorphochlora_amoeboformis.AAC.1